MVTRRIAESTRTLATHRKGTKAAAVYSGGFYRPVKFTAGRKAQLIAGEMDDEIGHRFRLAPATERSDDEVEVETGGRGCGPRRMSIDPS